MNKVELTKSIKELSLDLGFNLIGISKPVESNNYSHRLQEWLGNNYHASMQWINNRKEERKNIFNYFPEIKSIISFGYNYYTKGSNNEDNYKISKYAWGDDYHIVIKNKLYEILSFIKTQNKNLNYRVCVDTSPIMEKPIAQNAGLGWIGKHTNLINDKIGSWFFISEILLDIELVYDNHFDEDLCGTCTKCLDACPTNALSPYILDSNKCISYLTIEHRGEIVQEFSNSLDGWIYGCDICQEVCPWNTKFSRISNEKKFYKRSIIEEMENNNWKKITKKQYEEIFKKSAVKRTKYEGITRNIKLNNK